MARKAAKKPTAARYRVTAGTPNEREVGEYDTPSLAKGWLNSRLKARKKWGERYSSAAASQITSILEAVDGLNLAEAKKGREWEWRAVDEVSGVQFVWSLEVLW